jgi:hypothetical protein
MAEAKSADPTRPGDAAARVVPLGAPRPQAPRVEPVRDGVSWSAFGIAVALIVFAAVALIVQTQRVGALSAQVAGLETQLGTAQAQLATYHARLGLIRTSVAAVSDQVANLSALVESDPVAPPAEPADAAPIDSPDAP